MIPIISPEKKFIQTNRSNVLGNIWSSYNIDTQSNLGVVRVSPRLKLNTGNLNGLPWGFKYFDTKIWAGAGSKIYNTTTTPNSPNSSFLENADANVDVDFTSDESDMEVFNGALCATTTDALVSKAANGSGTGAWTNNRDSLTTGGQHVMCYFKKFDRLYYSDLSSIIRSINTSWATADPGNDYAINLSTDSGSYTITSIKSTSRLIFVGVIDKTKEGSVGKIITWGGLSSSIENEYPLSAQGCLALLIDKELDTPFAIDSRGRLLRFNGTGFSEVGRLPFSDKLLQIMNDLDAGDRFIHPNGMMMTDERTIKVLVNNINADSTFNENFQAGIYEFTPLGDGTYSCHHRGSPSYTSSTTITDYGQIRLSKVGALAPMNVYSNAAGRNGTFLCGATYYTNASTTANAIFYDDSNNTLQKAGYFVSSWVHASEIKDMWQKAVAKYRQFLDSADKIVVKYRIKEQASSSDITITWYNGGAIFKTSTSISDWAVGDEIEVIQGVGAGLCAHITQINDLGGGVTEVYIDEAISGAVNTDTAKIRIQKWIKTSAATGQTTESFKFPIGLASERVQIKCWMLFEGDDELFELGIINKPHEPI